MIIWKHQESTREKKIQKFRNLCFRKKTLLLGDYIFQSNPEKIDNYVKSKILNSFYYRLYCTLSEASTSFKACSGITYGCHSLFSMLNLHFLQPANNAQKNYNVHV